MDDRAYILNEWWEENEGCFIVPYIEQNFREVSWDHQFNLMQEFCYFARAIIDDFKMTDEEKMEDLVKALAKGKSKIVTIVGGRGSGKTATTLFIAEEVHKTGHDKIYYVGNPEHREIYPPWITFVQNLDDLPFGAFGMVDEAAIKYNARRFMTSENMDLTEKMVVLRHNDITLLLITQNLELIELNIRRLNDIVIYKMSSEYGIKKKRGETITKMERERMMIRQRLKPRAKSEVMVEYLSGAFPVFRKFDHPLPSFWDEQKISKSFRNHKTKKEAPVLAAESPY